MMGHRDITKTSAEYDLISGWRKVLCYMGRPGVTRSIKAGISRRIRREAKRDLARELRNAS